MNCYVCSIENRRAAANGACTHCGAALCSKHLREAQSYAIGGMSAYGCPHPVEGAEPNEQIEAVRAAIERRLRRAS